MLNLRLQLLQAILKRVLDRFLSHLPHILAAHSRMQIGSVSLMGRVNQERCRRGEALYVRERQMPWTESDRFVRSLTAVEILSKVPVSLDWLALLAIATA